MGNMTLQAERRPQGSLPGVARAQRMLSPSATRGGSKVSAVQFTCQPCHGVASQRPRHLHAAASTPHSPPTPHGGTPPPPTLPKGTPHAPPPFTPLPHLRNVRYDLVQRDGAAAGAGAAGAARAGGRQRGRRRGGGG